MKKTIKVKLPANSYHDEATGKIITVPPINKLAEDLAKKHNIEKNFALKQLEIGQKVETEHGGNEAFQLKTANDHLEESIHYYKELPKMEKKLDKMQEGGLVGSFDIKKSTHTKTGKDIWIVKPKSRLSKEEFNDVRKKIDKLGGYYSRFVSAFVFNEDPTEKLSGLSISISEPAPAGIDKRLDLPKLLKERKSPRKDVIMREIEAGKMEYAVFKRFDGMTDSWDYIKVDNSSFRPALEAIREYNDGTKVNFILEDLERAKGQSHYIYSAHVAHDDELGYYITFDNYYIRYIGERPPVEKKEEPKEPEPARREKIVLGTPNILKEIDLEEGTLIVEADFSKINKLETVEEFQEELARGFNREKVDLKKIVIVDDQSYKMISDNLSYGFEFWKGIGGSYVPDEIAKKYNIPASQDEFLKWLSDEANLKIYREFYLVIGVLIFNDKTKESFVVNTEGYDYARYVGFILPGYLEKVFTGKPVEASKISDELNKVSLGTRITSKDETVSIFKVNGTYVRDNFNVDYTEGGHHYKYDFIPENEVWIDNNLNDEDTEATIIHEMKEYELMKYEGLSYDEAHEKANISEIQFRLKGHETTIFNPEIKGRSNQFGYSFSVEKILFDNATNEGTVFINGEYDRYGNYKKTLNILFFSLKDGNLAFHDMIRAHHSDEKIVLSGNTRNEFINEMIDEKFSAGFAGKIWDYIEKEMLIEKPEIKDKTFEKEYPIESVKDLASKISEVLLSNEYVDSNYDWFQKKYTFEFEPKKKHESFVHFYFEVRTYSKSEPDNYVATGEWKASDGESYSKGAIFYEFGNTLSSKKLTEFLDQLLEAFQIELEPVMNEFDLEIEKTEKEISETESTYPPEIKETKPEIIAEKLIKINDEAIDYLSMESADEIYQNIEIQIKYKEFLDKKLVENNIPSELSMEIHDFLENENYHLLNWYLGLSGYYGKEVKQNFTKTANRLIKEYGKGSYVLNPKIFKITETKEPEAGLVPPAPVIETIEEKPSEEGLKLINQIRNVIDRNGTDRMKYSYEELKLLRTYPGMGGYSKMSERGTIERGLLDQYYTPYDVIEKMWGLALDNGFSFDGKKRILEPAAGIGRFLEYIPTDQDVVAYEIDIYAYTIAVLSFPDFEIINDSFETMFFMGKRRLGLRNVKDKFDLVIGNPPYREYVSKLSLINDAAGKNEKSETLAATFEQYMLMRGVDVLNPGGLLVFILPSSFMANDKKYNNFKNSLAKKADLVKAFRLPSSTFINTDIATDILVLRKK